MLVEALLTTANGSRMFIPSARHKLCFIYGKFKLNTPENVR